MFLKMLFFAQIFGQFSLIVFLLSSILSFLFVNPYTIDPSCRNYKNVDIREDIKQAVVEIQQLADNAFYLMVLGNQNTLNLLRVLFGDDPSRHVTVKKYSKPLSILFTCKILPLCATIKWYNGHQA